MKLTSDHLHHLADQACHAAREAGALIAGYCHHDVEVREKDAGSGLASQVVTEVDERSEALIVDLLNPSIEAHDLAILTEEREDDERRMEKDYFWCVDPLDGTLPFTRGIPGYSVSIALVRKDGRAMIGVIYDPVTRKLYRAVAGAGVEIDGQAFRPSLRSDGPLKFFCDCTFPMHPERDALIEEVAQVATREGYPGIEVIEGAGGVLNACHVLTDGPACYFKKPKMQQGGGSLWDFAATACLFDEAGLHARDFDGLPLDLNRPDSTYMNHRGVCFASTPDLAAALRDAHRGD